jgi:5-methylcytosine-specific restriction protein B
MRGGDAGVPYAAYIHPQNADSGVYVGVSFVIFPADDAPCLVAMVIGTQGLASDEAILGRPGHARKIHAICAWLNRRFGGGAQVAWAKQDPTRFDIDVPEAIQKAWSQYERALKRYGRWLYGIYRPTGDRAGTIAALTAMLDVLFQERNYTPLKEFENDAQSVQSAWFEHLMPVRPAKKAPKGSTKANAAEHAARSGSNRERHINLCRCLDVCGPSESLNGREQGSE